MKCTFFNSGNYFHFNPDANYYPPNDAPPQKAIDFYRSLVKLMDRPDCFLVESMPEAWHKDKPSHKNKKKTYR